MTTGGRFIVMNTCSHINGGTTFLTNQITKTILKFNSFYNKSFKKICVNLKLLLF